MQTISKNQRAGRKRWQPRLEALEARRLLSNVWADFNGDGFEDMAIGVPEEDVGSVVDAGAVHIIYGSVGGLTLTGNQLWTQDSAGVLDTAETGDLFGAALAGGDFNNDGRADLAIGAPGEQIGAVAGAGQFHIFFGSSAGLISSGNQVFHQDSPRVREIGEFGDQFGSALATGHLNGDAFADLVIGTPEEDVGSVEDAGAISVFYGGPGGITPVGNQNFSLESGNMIGVAGDFDAFGAELTSGDFNNDGRDDVAIGTPFADVDDFIGIAELAGSVTVMYSTAAGLTSTGNQLWTQASPGVSDGAFNADVFGRAVAAGDFNGDGFGDLAIGVINEDAGGNFSAGAFHVLYGSGAGITATGEQFFNQGDAGGTSDASDFFGSTMAAADFNGDGRTDLAIGTPSERVGVVGPDEAGAVNVMYGSSTGITKVGAFEITQEDVGTGDSSEEGDEFGDSLGTGDFNGNGKADLAIGAPFEDIGVTILDAGRVWTLYGSSTGFTGGQSWGQDTAGVLDVSEINDRFGSGLDAGNSKTAPHGGSGLQDVAHLITADQELDSYVTKTQKRRTVSGRR